MSILDPQEMVCNRAEIAHNYDNPLHVRVSDIEYESMRSLYYPIRLQYQQFILQYCCDDDLAITNANIIRELEKVNVITTASNGIVFSNLDDLNAMREYVIMSQYPASYQDMIDFFHEVKHGILEFLCRYPNEKGETPLGLISKSKYKF